MAARRPRPIVDEYYEDDRDDYDDFQQDEQYYEQSPKASVYERDYYPPAPNSFVEAPLVRQGGPVEADGWLPEDDDDGDRDDYDDARLPEEGNFWSNPKAGFDVPRRRPRQPPSRRPVSERRSFRAGAPPPPEPVADFYNRIFWFGFDPSEASDTDNSPTEPDRTMFGGTKGKFNGLTYLGQDSRPLRRSRRPRGEAPEPEPSLPPRRDWPVTPPYDLPYPRRSAPTRVSSRRIPETRKNNVDEDKDWVSRKVSTWFEDDEDEEDRDETLSDDGARRRSTRKKSGPWSVFDTFFGLNRRDLDQQAQMYNQQIGLDNEISGETARGVRRDNARRNQRRPRRPPTEQVPDMYPEEEGYRENYVDNNSNTADSSEAVIEAEAIVEEEEEESRFSMDWEERALAVERVPPADMPAWGPKGYLGIDARTKAIEDALEDISDARARVNEAEKKVEETKEEVSILRIDAELERKRLMDMQIEPRVVQQKIRRVNQEVEEVARALRYANMQARNAKDALAELEKRHWAVLSFYSAEKAEKGVALALEELYEAEPAARRAREKLFGARDNEICKIMETTATNVDAE